jgi:hypothetical protein
MQLLSTRSHYLKCLKFPDCLPQNFNTNKWTAA